MDIARRFGANLLRCRRRVGLSQEALAEMASVHRTEVGLLENGRRIPRIDTLVKLAFSLEVQADELLDGIEWVPAPPRRGAFFLSPRARSSQRGQIKEAKPSEK